MLNNPYYLEFIHMMWKYMRDIPVFLTLPWVYW